VIILHILLLLDIGVNDLMGTIRMLDLYGVFIFEIRMNVAFYYSYTCLN